jgi:hypothetical protein
MSLDAVRLTPAPVMSGHGSASEPAVSISRGVLDDRGGAAGGAPRARRAGEEPSME